MKAPKRIAVAERVGFEWCADPDCPLNNDGSQQKHAHSDSNAHPPFVPQGNPRHY
jgi:hypothetical protein